MLAPINPSSRWRLLMTGLLAQAPADKQLRGPRVGKSLRCDLEHAPSHSGEPVGRDLAQQPINSDLGPWGLTPRALCDPLGFRYAECLHQQARLDLAITAAQALSVHTGNSTRPRRPQISPQATALSRINVSIAAFKAVSAGRPPNRTVTTPVPRMAPRRKVR